MDLLNYTDAVYERIVNVNKEEVFIDLDFLDIADYHTVRQSLGILNVFLTACELVFFLYPIISNSIITKIYPLGNVLHSAERPWSCDPNLSAPQAITSGLIHISVQVLICSYTL